MSRHTRLAAATLALMACTAGVVAWIGWDRWVVAPALRSGLSASLPDPSSARFEIDAIVGDTVCGKVDARSSDGTYRGVRSYIASRERYFIEGDSGSTWDDSTAFTIEQRDHGRAVIQSLAAKRAADPSASSPSAEQIRALTNSRVFWATWVKVCRARA